MIFNQAPRNRARNGLAAEELLDFNAHMRVDTGTSRLRPWHLTPIHPSPPPYLTYLTAARLLYVPTRSSCALLTHPQTLEPSSPAPSWLSHIEPSRPYRLESRLCRCLSSLGTEGLIALWYREVSCSHGLLPLSITGFSATWTLDVVCQRKKPISVARLFRHSIGALQFLGSRAVMVRRTLGTICPLSVTRFQPY
jgi:hypothetical protein